MTLSRNPEFLLSVQQRRVLAAIQAYHRATGEPCPGRYLARRLAMHHSTVQRHVEVLHRKGHVRGPNPPSVPLDTSQSGGTANLAER